MLNPSQKVFMVILAFTVTFSYLFYSKYIQLPVLDFVEIKNYVFSAWKPAGDVTMTRRPKTITDETTEIMAFINGTMPQVEAVYLNETTSAVHSTTRILNNQPKYCIGNTLIVQIDMFNYLGERKTYGGDYLRARIFSPKLGAGASGRIEDFNNGSYNVYFTLFWEGPVQISILLMHPSEGVAALWKNRNIGCKFLKYTGTFLNKSREVHTECGLELNSQNELCEYKDKKYGDTFYCMKLPGIPCEAFISLRSENIGASYLTNVGRSVLLTRSNIAVEIPNKVGRIDVVQCSKTFMNVTSKCKTGMSPPFPGGYFLHNQWFPIHCNLPSFEPLSNIETCLAGKMIYLMGDSTLRQWILFLPTFLKDLKFFNIIGTGWHKLYRAFDSKNNIFIQWKKHGHPFVTNTFFNMKDHSYTTNEIDRLAGGPNTIIVISLGQHFRPFPLPLFIKRILNVRKAIQNLFLRSPDTKVIIKSENTRDFRSEVEESSDFHGYIQYLVVKKLFSGVNVGIIDTWDMTVAFASNNGHPPDIVLKNQINMFLSFIC